MTRAYPAGIYSLLLIFLLTACSTPREQEAHGIAHPVIVKKYALASAPALTLRAWMPPGEPKALIIGVHGFNDYSNAFAPPAPYFNRHGIGVIAYDQRGFGRTPQTGIWAGEQNLAADLREAVRAVRKQYPHTPVYVLGESMGGAVAIVAMARPDFPRVNGLILAAPAIWGGKSMNGFFRASLWLLAHTMPATTIESTSNNLKILASDNIEMLYALGRDPLVIKKTRIDAVYGMMHLMDSAYTHIEALHTPVLLLYGAKDQIIPPRPVKDALLNLRAPYTFAYYENGYHMLLRDLQAKVVLSDIVAWTHNHQAPLPSGADRKWKERELMQQAAKEPSPIVPSHILSLSLPRGAWK